MFTVAEPFYSFIGTGVNTKSVVTLGAKLYSLCLNITKVLVKLGLGKSLEKFQQTKSSIIKDV
jgi:hypothetical protein